MAKRNVTLKQIAEEAGVSTTTVHRVLNDKEGCGEELKAKILQIAKEQGYTVNVSASSLRKKTIYIGLVFPSKNESSRFFMGRILDGYHRFQQDLTDYDIQFREYFYDYDDPESMCPILKKICQDDPVRFDGIALWGITASQKVTGMLNRLQGKGIPIMMLERAPADPDLYDCCVGPDEQMVGAMAGEMIRKLTRRSGKVLLITQALGYPDPNGEACIRVLSSRTDLEPVVLELPLVNGVHVNAVRTVMGSMENIVAVYATCARHTLAAIRVIREQGYELDAAIGSEVFEESMQALDDGTLSAVVNKCPHSIGYQALQMLFNRLVKNEHLPKQYCVMPMIVLQANKEACQNY